MTPGVSATGTQRPNGRSLENAAFNAKSPPTAALPWCEELVESDVQTSKYGFFLQSPQTVACTPGKDDVEMLSSNDRKCVKFVHKPSFMSENGATRAAVELCPGRGLEDLCKPCCQHLGQLQ